MTIFFVLTAAVLCGSMGIIIAMVTDQKVEEIWDDASDNCNCW